MNEGQSIPDNDCGKLVIHRKNVSFACRTSRKVKVQCAIELKLNRGKIVALYGKSGRGEASATRLIQRFYDPTDSCIESNGIDIRCLDVGLSRAQIRVISQDPVLPDITFTLHWDSIKRTQQEDQNTFTKESSKLRSYQKPTTK